MIRSVGSRKGSTSAVSRRLGRASSIAPRSRPMRETQQPRMPIDVGSRKGSTSAVSRRLGRASSIAPRSRPHTRDPTTANANRCWVSQGLDPTTSAISRRLGRASSIAPRSRPHARDPTFVSTDGCWVSQALDPTYGSLRCAGSNRGARKSNGPSPWRTWPTPSSVDCRGYCGRYSTKPTRAAVLPLK